MSSFRTTLSAFDPKYHLDHSSSVLSMGSCFAEHMAARLSNLKFNCHSNPFGILYHPQNIANCLEMCFAEYAFTSNDLTERDGYWYSLWHHSKVNKNDSQDLISKLDDIQRNLTMRIQQSKLFIFTFGTAYYYEHLDTGIPVGNCHKISANQFEKKRSNPDSIADQYKKILRKILELNQDAKFIFTVSPIRHVKDGIIENNRSKAILHLAIDQIVSEIPQASYFPAYEIMMDDLRDYRFYTADLLHPSEVAIHYIWERFAENLFSNQSKQLLEKVYKIKNALAHKAFQPNSQQHQKFLKDTLANISTLEKTNPALDFTTEKENLSSHLV